jgi:hypothetical protein
MNKNMQIPVTLPEETFKAFLFSCRWNRRLLWFAVGLIIIQFAIFKYVYPFASYIHGDSFVYLQIAEKNLDIETYMVGYGRFLRLFSVFSTSDLALTAFQYLLIQASAFFLFFTLNYFYRPARVVQMTSYVFIVLNPLFLHMGNMVSSDGFFLALSLIWITLVLWLVHRPSTRIVVWHAIVFFIAFTVRYNALIYPFIALLAGLLSRQAMAKKLLGIGAGLLLCTCFVLYTGFKYKALTGKWQYSPFSGWLLTNNAMYAYRYVDKAHRKPVPQRFKVLDNMIRAYFDSTRNTRKFPAEKLMASTVYMWSPGLPMFAYRDMQFKKDTSATELKKWASMGPFYAEYGSYIIRHYPLYYARYFIWPNAQKYYAPPVEFLATYNSGVDYVTHDTQKWFGYKSTKVMARTKTPETLILDFYPIYSGIINVVMLCGLVCFAMLGGFRKQMLFRNGLLLGAAVWLLNAAFTIYASSAALRFQAFPIVLTSLFTFLVLDYLWKMGMAEADTERSKASDIITERAATAAIVPANEGLTNYQL